jgi:hypothetical protein
VRHAYKPEVVVDDPLGCQLVTKVDTKVGIDHEVDVPQVEVWNVLLYFFHAPN